MSTITFPELTETLGKLNERRKALHVIFDEAGPEMDMAKVKSVDGDSTAKVEAIRALNEEIDELAKKAEGLRVIAKGAEHAAEYDDDDHAEKGSGRPQRAKSLGEAFAEALKAAPDRKTLKTELDIALKTTMTTSAGWAAQAIRGPRVVEYATRPAVLLDFIPQVPTDQTANVYMEETTFTNNAVETSEGVLFGEAALALTERTSTVRKIPVFLPVTDEQLEDVPRCQAYIENRLPFMIRQRLGSQILVGDGSAPNLRGLLNTSGIQTQAKGSDPTPDAVYKAMVLVMSSGFADPDLAVFNALDWQDIRLLRTADGIYIWGSPSEAGPNRIWGLPVVLDQGLTQNTAVVGAFQVFSELSVKKGLTVEVGYNSDDWTKGKQTIRAEIRCAITFYRPAAFAQITGI